MYTGCLQQYKNFTVVILQPQIIYIFHSVYHEKITLPFILGLNCYFKRPWVIYEVLVIYMNHPISQLTLSFVTTTSIVPCSPTIWETHYFRLIVQLKRSSGCDKNRCPRSMLLNLIYEGRQIWSACETEQYSL